MSSKKVKANGASQQQETLRLQESEQTRLNIAEEWGLMAIKLYKEPNIYMQDCRSCLKS